MAALTILQWNAQGLLNHGPELIKYLELHKDEKYHLICIQETWFNNDRILQIPEYTGFFRNRETQLKGGCAIYVHDTINYEYPIHDKEFEMQHMKIHVSGSKISVVNFYNPCKKLNDSILNRLTNKIEHNQFLIVGDFNAHNPLWGSEKTDQNGTTVENFIHEKDFVILNDGAGTRIDPRSGKFSCLDLSITSPKLSSKCSWSVMQHTFGSDHFPIFTQLLLDGPQKVNSYAENENKEEPNTWSFKNIDWSVFAERCENITECSGNFTDAKKMYTYFMKRLKDIIKEIMPPRGKKKHDPVPWWTKDCTKSIKERNKASNKLKRHISTENLDTYLKKKSEAQKTLRKAERRYWQEFCLRLNRFIPESQVWTTIKRLNGVSVKRTKNMSVLIENEKEIICNREKTEVFCEFFKSVSNVKECPEIERNKDIEEVITNSKKQGLEHVMNEPFTFFELEKTLNTCKRSAPGKDKIPYQVYQKLPQKTKQIMLKVMNLIWDSGNIPADLKHSILIPVLKQNKDPKKVSSYRPIALTPCFIKLLERMIKNRLQWYIEKNNILPPFMTGFRSKRGITDNIVLLENSIQKSINVGEYTLVVFLDIEKAYDRLCTKGLIFKLTKYGIKGKMLNFLHNYLKERTFQVRVGKEESKVHEIYNGLPQGSVLSPLLYNIMMSDIPTDELITTSIYADDCVIWMSGNSIETISNRIQCYLNTLSEWLTKWGFRLSESKTVPVLFTKNNKAKDPELRLNNDVLLFQSKKQFLGLVFDKRLTWQSHIDAIVLRCKKKLNILRCLTGTTWGSSSKSLLMVYRALIRSLIDYGCEAYDSASPSVKKPLDSIQYQALRICAGALPLTSLESLQVELGEMPLDLRRQMLAERFRQKITMHLDHPITLNVQPSWQMELLKRQKNNRPFGCRTKLMENCIIEPYVTSCFPPWIIQPPNVSIELSKIVNKDENPCYLRQCSLELLDTKWPSQLHIYTDGSKVPDQGICSASFYVPAFSYHQSKRLTNNTSSFRAELAAIVLALSWLENINVYVGTVILSDSLSALHAIKEQKEISFVTEITTLITKLSYQGKNIYLEWVPSHCGLYGNEMADFYAKSALVNNIEICNKLSLSEIKSILFKKYRQFWQDRWNLSHCLLRRVEPEVNQIYSCKLKRSHESILHRLRIGIIGLNADLFRLNIHPTGHCIDCNAMETVNHFLTECPKYIIERTMLLVETNLSEPREIIRLLKSSEVETQKAIVRFVLRTKRLYKDV